MAGGHLLVIDDEPAVSMVLEHACARWGYALTTVRTLAGGRRELREHTFDLAIIDVGLPDGDGLELLADLRGDPRWADLPAIVLTGAGDDDVADRARELRAHTVTKPFSPTKLGELVNSLVGGD